MRMVGIFREVSSVRRFLAGAAIFVVAACGHLPASRAQGSAQSAAGLWEKTDDAGKPDAWFRIYQCGDAYYGQIVKMFPKNGQNPASFRCAKCEGDQKDAPVLGLTFIKNMQRDGLQYENGTILDPRDGSVYNANMQLSPDGQQLTVRGYLLMPLLGQSQVWHRIHGTKSDLPKLRPDACPTEQRQGYGH
jgi:uncharacterized protein (DUF2147 family)